MRMTVPSPPPRLRRYSPPPVGERFRSAALPHAPRWGRDFTLRLSPTTWGSPAGGREGVIQPSNSSGFAGTPPPRWGIDFSPLLADVRVAEAVDLQAQEVARSGVAVTDPGLDV